ncbi:MAG: hypothetical protein U1F67_26700, partial [Rubrivivax sp.]
MAERKRAPAAPATATSPPRARAAQRAATQAAVAAIAYAGVGWVALMLAGPPGYAAPLYPPAGIALAAALAWGRPGVLGGLVGAFAVNASLGWLRGQT